MKRLLLLSALLVPFHPVNAQPDADTNRTFQVELKVVSVPQGALASNAYTLTATAITVRSNRQWSLAGQVDDAGALLDQLQRDTPRFDVLSSPTVLVRGGQEAQVRIERSIAYLAPETGVLFRVHHPWYARAPRVEAVRSGLYRVQQLEETRNPGLAITFTATPAAAAVEVALRLRYNLMVNPSGRTHEGVLLEAPEIESRQIETQVRVTPDKWAVLGGMPQVRRAHDQARESLLVFMRVREVSPAADTALRDRPADPPPADPPAPAAPAPTAAAAAPAPPVAAAEPPVLLSDYQSWTAIAGSATQATPDRVRLSGGLGIASRDGQWLTADEGDLIFSNGTAVAISVVGRAVIQAPAETRMSDMAQTLERLSAGGTKAVEIQVTT